MINYVLFFIGVIIVLVSTVLLKKNMNYKSSIDLQTAKNKEFELLNSIDLAGKVIEELKIISENTINRLDEKSNDIYQMIQIVDQRMDEYLSIIKDTKENTEQSKLLNEVYKEQYMELENNSDENIKRIFSLLNEGYSASQIAKQLDKGIGEIQLICNLKKR